MRAVLSLVLSLLFVSTSHAANIFIFKGDANNDYMANNNTYFVQIHGDIVEGDAAKLQRELNRISHRDYLVYVYLNSGGGIVREAMQMGRILRGYGAFTYVGSLNMTTTSMTAGRCHSACTAIFAGGVWRFMPKNGSTLGVHQFSSDGYGDEARAQYLVSEELRYFREMDVDSAEINRLAKGVSPNNILILTDNVLWTTNLVNDGYNPARWHINTLKDKFFLQGAQSSWAGDNRITLVCNDGTIELAVFSNVGKPRVEQIKRQQWLVNILVDDAELPIKNAEYRQIKNQDVVAVVATLDRATAQRIANIKKWTGVSFKERANATTFVGGYIEANQKQRDMLKSFIATCH